VVALLLSAVWQWRTRYRTGNVEQLRSSQARKKARKALSAARRRDEDAYAAIGNIMYEYLSDKMHQPVKGLTTKALAELLVQSGIQPQLAEQVQNTLMASQLGRFSPQALQLNHGDQLLEETDSLIGRLEQEFQMSRKRV
jgi:hypothetical protein